MESITSAVHAAQAKVAALPVSKLVRRQTSTALASLVEDLLLEVSGALNNIISTLGLSKHMARKTSINDNANVITASLLSSLEPLVSALSGLLLALEVVVNDLLALVEQLLDGLLTGLSVGLSGLSL